MYKLKNKPLTKSLGPYSLKLGPFSLKQPQNRFFIPLFYHFGAIWEAPNGPKKVLKGPQVGGMYDPMSKLKNKPLTKSIGPFLQEKWSKTTRKQFFYAVFGHFGAIWASPSGSKKVHKALQVDWMYSPMSKHRNRPPSKSLGPLF
jgi:hypothetical protein